jgi:hypothetical protein
LQKVGKSQSIFSRPQLKLALEDVEERLVEEQEIFSEQQEQAWVLEPQLQDWATSIFSEITLNSNNSAKLSNNNHKCLSLSSNKSALVIHNWRS